MKIHQPWCRAVGLRGTAILFYLLIILAGTVEAQTSSEHLVTGTVTDEGGSPLPGATIILPGTNRGAVSDAEGNFTLTIPNATGETITVQTTFLGFQRTQSQVQANPGQTTTLAISLRADPLSLDEVVVTGTSVGTSKRQIGNAISTVQVSDFPATVATSVDQLLTGKVAGAQITQNSGNPAGGISIRLRGPSTIVGSSDPLYIVDGVIVNNSSPELIDLGGYAQNRLVDINPNDIERIEIIKGAAAAAIYGSRANNGVVQIFTKRGRVGKPQVEFSTQLRMNEIRKALPYNDYPFAFTNTTVSDLTQIPVQRYDYQDKIFRKGIGTDNYLSVSGGTDVTQYFFSVSNFYNQGIVDNTDYSRNSVRMRIEQNFGDIATLSIGSSFSLSDSREIPNGGITEAYGALTGFIFSNNFVNPEKDAATGVYPSTAPVSVLRRTNPLEAIDRFDFRQRISRYIGDVQLQVTPLSGLSINYNLGIDTYTQLAQGYIPPNNTTPSYNLGFSRRADLNVFQINNDLTVTYQDKIADWLESTTGLGGTIQYDRSYTTAISAQQLGTFGETINNGSNIVASENRVERAILGAFVQQTFGISDKVFVTGAARVDASSVYGEDNRWQFFPKVSGSYILSEEDFWSGLSAAVSTFKIRAAWGQSGNLTAIGAYDRFTNYTPASVGSLVGYTSPLTLGNFDVKPERQTEFEAGFDMALLNDRVGVEFSYFTKDVEDLILNRTLAPSTAYNNRFINVGTMTNKGFEVQMRATAIQADNVSWSTVLSYTRNDNTVTGVEGRGVLPFAGGFGQVAAVNGYPLGAFYSTFFARNDDGTLLLNANGLPQRELGTQGSNGTYTVGRNPAGQPMGTVLSKVIGDPNPKHIVSWVNDVQWKNLTFRMQWDGMLGFDVFNFTRRVGDRDLYGGLEGYEPELRGEVPKGTSAALFSVFENWIEDGSFIKLRELSVSYAFQPQVLGIENMRIFIAGRNLVSIDSYSGYDPETNAAGQTNAVRGFDFVEVPIPRSYAIGLNLKF